MLDVRDAVPAAAKKESWTSWNALGWLPARSVDVEVGLRQIAVMIRSGLTLLDALNTASQQAQRPAMGRMWASVADQIQEGSSLGDAMIRHARFSPMVVELVRVGSQTGRLEPVLIKAAESLESRRNLRASVLTALAYPLIVVLAAIGVTAFMALDVIPKLEKFLSTIGRRLPAVTVLLMDITHQIQANAPYALLAVAVGGVLVTAACMWPRSRLWIDRLALRIPLMGGLLRLAGTIAFASNLGSLLQSGIRLLEGLRTVERLQRNRFLALQVSRAREAVIHGGNLATPLSDRHGFMPMLSRMLDLCISHSSWRCLPPEGHADVLTVSIVDSCGSGRIGRAGDSRPAAEHPAAANAEPAGPCGGRRCAGPSAHAWAGGRRASGSRCAAGADVSRPDGPRAHAAALDLEAGGGRPRGGSAGGAQGADPGRPATSDDHLGDRNAASHGFGGEPDLAARGG